jgi:hypothetical protein
MTKPITATPAIDQAGTVSKLKKCRVSMTSFSVSTSVSLAIGFGIWEKQNKISSNSKRHKYFELLSRTEQIN